MRKIRIVLGIALGVFVVAVAAIWLLADPNRHRETIQARLEKQLGRQVSLGDMSIGFLPLRFQVSNPVISEDPKLDQKAPFIRAEKLDVRIGLLPLLAGNVRMDSLELRRPSVELIKTKQGTWNFSTLGAGTDSPNEAATSADDKPDREFALSRLTIIDGQVGITDLSRKQPRTAYDHIDLTLRDYAPGTPFSFDLALHTEGSGAQEVRLKGEAGPVPASNPSATPVRAVLNLNEVGLDSLAKFLDNKSSINAQGVLSGESNIESQAGKLTSGGRLELAGARFNGVDIGYPIGLDYKLGANIADGVVTIETATLQLGKTPLSVAGLLRTASTPAVIDLKIKSGSVPIGEIARLASAFGVAFSPTTTVNGRVSADVQAKGPATKPTVTGTIAGRDLQISGQGVPQPVQVPAVDLALSPASIQSNEFTATSGKTTLMGRFSVLQYASPSPSVDVSLRAPGATLPEVQSIAKAYGATGLDQISGEGTMNFDLRATGPLKSMSSTDATRTLNGIINLNFSPLKVAGFDAVHELSQLVGLASGTDQRVTDIVRVIGRIVVKNGVAQTDDLRAELGVGNLSATGNADLATEALNLRLSAVFSKAFTEKFGATRGGRLMNAALTNNSGELVVPAIVTGTFKQPKFAPDLQAVAQMQKQKLLPTLANPAALKNVLGTLTGKTKDGEQEPAEQEKEKGSPLRGILDIFKRKK